MAYLCVNVYIFSKMIQYKQRYFLKCRLGNICFCKYGTRLCVNVALDTSEGETHGKQETKEKHIESQLNTTCHWLFFLLVILFLMAFPGLNFIYVLQLYFPSADHWPIALFVF